MSEAPDDLTAIRATVSGPADAESLLSLVYEELRASARGLMRHEAPGRTIQATALVHEAFIRLVDARVDWVNRGHFCALAAREMRRILIDHARARGRGKRGGGRERTELDVAVAAAPGVREPDPDLAQALERFAADYERQARVVELRWYAGLSVEETAALLGVSHRSVEKDTKFALAWLKRELGRMGGAE